MAARHTRTALLAALGLWAACGLSPPTATAQAQPFPNRPIRFIVPFPAGGVSDVAARVIGQKFTERWGQQVLVENRLGAGGTIGTALAAAARPDGYTLLMGSSTELALNPNLYSKLSYDTLRDFAPVALIGQAPLLAVVHPALPVKSLKELQALARARPGELNFASTGNGSTLHVGAEMFLAAAGVTMTHVPQTSNAQLSVMTGQAQLMFSSLPGGISFVRAGRLRALAVTGAQRFPTAPDIPTAIESGFPTVEVVIWVAAMAPAGTPTDIVDALGEGVLSALRLPDVKKSFDNVGLELTPGDANHLAAYLRRELAKFGKAVKAAGIRLD
jgi:tripartite-type tricarboxylate transporter receptor subunit TctC